MLCKPPRCILVSGYCYTVCSGSFPFGFPGHSTPFAVHLMSPHPLPNTLLQHQGLPSIPFCTWLSSYKGYIRLLELDWDDFPDGIKKTLLFQLLSSEGMRQFGKKPVAACMDNDTLFCNLLQCCRRLFQKPIKPVCAHLDLHNHHQGQCKTRAKFVAALQELLPNCKFDVEHQKEHPAMQLLAGRCSDAGQKWMLLEDAINLDKDIDILLSEESAIADIAAFGAAACTASSSSTNVGAVNPSLQSKGQQWDKGCSSKQGSGMGHHMFFVWQDMPLCQGRQLPSQKCRVQFLPQNWAMAGCCHMKRSQKLQGSEHKGGSAKKIDLGMKAIIPGMSIEQPY